MNIQKFCSDLFGNACYAFCIAYMFSDPERRSDIKYLTSQVVNGWVMGYIDDDGFVSKPVQLANTVSRTSKYRDVKKVNITSLNDLPDGLYAVEFDFGVKKHFVVCRKGEIVWDSWPESDCVKYGKPTSFRLYI